MINKLVLRIILFFIIGFIYLNVGRDRHKTANGPWITVTQGIKKNIFFCILIMVCFFLTEKYII